MASPVIEQTVASNNPTTASTTHTITAVTATAGQLAIVVADKGSTAATVTDDWGLTELLDENLANGLYIAYRWMDGNEASTFTLTTSAATRLVTICRRISGAENPSTQAPEINGTTASGTGSNPDPPAAVMTGGSKDYLVLAMCGSAGEQADDGTYVSVWPTNYTLGQTTKTCGVAGTSLGGLVASAGRQLTASAEDPGTFTVSETAGWRSQTITIHPAASADVTVPVTAGSVAWSGQTLTAITTSVPVAAAAATWSGQTVTANTTVSVTAGSVEWQGQTVTVSIAQVVSIVAGSVIWSGQSLTANQTVAVTAASITWTGQTVTIQIATVVPVTAGSVTWSGRSVSESIRVPVTAASITWAGQTINIAIATVIPVTAGSVVWAGQTVNVLVPMTVPVTAGSILWQGQNVVLIIPGQAEPVRGPTRKTILEPIHVGEDTITWDEANVDWDDSLVTWDGEILVDPDMDELSIPVRSVPIGSGHNGLTEV